MQSQSKPKIGLALAGGGPEGAIYEIGALRALEHAVEGLDLSEMNIYVGVSAGAFISANLANGLSTRQMVRALIKSDPGEHPFKPEIFVTPAFSEFIRSSLRIPELCISAISQYLGENRDHGILQSLTLFGRAIPVGLFDNNPIAKYLLKVNSKPGRTDDFRLLKSKLRVVATDLDASEAVVFGSPGHDDVPISTAVQASTALPALYPPVEINGRYYVDGVLLKTLHASTILDEELDLALFLNPIVPIDTKGSVESGFLKRGRLVDRGMPAVLSQTFRTLIHSRMQIGFRPYRKKYPKTDMILLEPPKDDFAMFFTNIFSFKNRKVVCEHAFNSVLRDLSKRRAEIAPIFEKHGMRLRTEFLDHPDCDVWGSVGLREESPTHQATYQLKDALIKLEQAVARKVEEQAKAKRAKLQAVSQEVEEPVA